MQKKLSLFVASFVLLGLSACSLLPEKADETKNWSVTKLYAEAREEMDGGHYEAAIKLFERLESSYPFGTYATQAQMEIAYAYYKTQDQAQALAAVERFIKLHPNHPQADYMYYLRGLISFNDQIGFLSGDLFAGSDRARPESDARIVRRLQGAGRQVPGQQIHAGRDLAHEVPGQRDGAVRSARGQLLLPPRRLPGRLQPGRRAR